MTTEDQNSPTNRNETAEAGTPDQLSAMPRMSPPNEASKAIQPEQAGRVNWMLIGRAALILLFVLILVSILLPSFSRRRPSTRRISCASNIRSISSACLIYAAGNRGFLPTEPSSVGSGSPDEGQACVVGKNGLKSNSELWGIRDGKRVFMGSGSNPRQYFRLLAAEARGATYLKSKSFTCPTAVNTVNHRQEDAAASVPINGKQTPVYDFNGSNGDKRPGANCTEMTDFSYSFQVVMEGRDPDDPTEIRGGALSDSRDDPRKALVADRNPYSNEVQSRSELVAGQYGTGTYVYSPGAKTKFAAPPAAYNNIKDLTGRNANSRNHNQDGQMVGYLDGHGKWNNTSLAGADEDCIWMTLNKQGTGPRIPLTGLNYGLMRSKKSWATDSLLIP